MPPRLVAYDGFDLDKPIEVPPPAGSLDALLFRPTLESLQATPPPRKFLLRTSDGTGAFPAGKVGCLAAPGGAGKTKALMQLTVAVATGGTWLGPGGWKVEPGRVLFLLAEDDQDEAERTLYFAARAAGLTSTEDFDLIADNVDLIPL